MSHRKTFTYSLYPSNRSNKWILIIKTQLDDGKHYTSTYDIAAETSAQARRQANKRMARLRMRWTPVGPGFRAEVIDQGLKTR